MNVVPRVLSCKITSLKETHIKDIDYDENAFVMHGQLHALDVAKSTQPRFASPQHTISGFQELWHPQRFRLSIQLPCAVTEPEGWKLWAGKDETVECVR